VTKLKLGRLLEVSIATPTVLEIGALTLVLASLLLMLLMWR
jgi:hypothetical protein